MKTLKGDIFYPHTYYPKLGNPDAVCIPVNGYTRSDGCNVMGRGIAEQTARIFPKMPRLLGSAIRNGGNNVHCFGPLRADFPFLLATFPVKPSKDAFNGHNVVGHMAHRFKVGETIPGWACKAQLSIIKRSCKQLVTMTDEKAWTKVVVPRVGCGAGELLWSDVETILSESLDDRFYCITYHR